ncbi:O-antigen ligase family protein [Pseudomonas sp. GT1P32]
MVFNKNNATIAVAALTAICLIQQHGFIFYLGVAGIYSLIILAAFSPWLGLLALFPLLFSLPPAPATIGITELSFALLLAVIFVGALVKLSRSASMRVALKYFGLALLVGLLVLAVNLFVAVKNGVPLVDWARGAIPFLFIYNFLSVAILVGNDENRIRWLGGSIATLIFMLSGYIVFYYFYNDIWRPYWLVLVDDRVVRMSETAALHYSEALGPMRDRVTMMVAQSTDALLPVGVVLGVVLATLARRKSIVTIGLLMALTCLFAVLTTFTRSMLLSSLLITFVFTAFIFMFRKELRLKVVKIGTALGVAGVVFMFATGMQDVWTGRMSQLTEIRTGNLNDFYSRDPSLRRKLDFNVSSRLEEYKIAWSMFVSHPLLGNGLGIKHEMQWQTAENELQTKWVAYVHNWVFYILMVGGIAGFFVYSVVLMGPLFFRLSRIKSESTHWTIIRAAVLTMIVYGAFFAVFRLITFNLLISVIWGVIFAQILADRRKSQSSIKEEVAL